LIISEFVKPALSYNFLLLCRFLRKLKCYVRNKARPEGSMAEGYILEECLLFCSKYLHDIETRYNQPERNSDGLSDDYGGLSVFSPSGAPLEKAKSKCLTEEEWRQARDYVLKNCDELQPYLRSLICHALNMNRL